MAQPASSLHYFPQTARLAATILTAPLIDFRFMSDSSIPAGQYRVNKVKAIITSADGNVSAKALRDLSLESSLSTNEVMLSLVHDPDLQKNAPELRACLKTAHEKMLKLQECFGLDEPTPLNMLDIFDNSVEQAKKIIKPALINLEERLIVYSRLYLISLAKYKICIKQSRNSAPPAGLDKYFKGNFTDCTSRLLCYWCNNAT